MTGMTIVIPTYNRAPMLADVLTDLMQQNAADVPFEVLVVDDGSTDETPQLLAQLMAESPGCFRYVRQDNSGLNTARNRGASEANDELLVYLDDDVRLPPDFVNEMAAAFKRRPEAGAVAGRILLQMEAEVPPWLEGSLRLYLSELDLGESEHLLPPPQYPRGACFGVRRRVIDDVGGFVPELDRRGTSLISSGEQEFFQRVHRAKVPIVYWPGATVRHRVPPERLTFAYFARRARAQGTSDALLERARPTPRQVTVEVLRTARVAGVLAKGMLTGKGAIRARLWWQYCSGRWAGTLGARR